ncbi:MAG TPA: hypothetical protein VFN67_42685 [Polyangiales bacterium]|nr:hypothetical protein [Polyangiales bacterium]
MSEAEEQRMIAAALATEEESAEQKLYIGASIGVDAVRAFRSPHARGLGASASFTAKQRTDVGSVVAQFGISAWPSALYRGPEQAEERLDSWEAFLTAAIHPLTLGPLDLGFYLLLAAGHNLQTDVADRVALGVSAQWSFDRMWALRYQFGCTMETNIVSLGMVSALAIDMVFPYS